MDYRNLYSINYSDMEHIPIIVILVFILIFVGVKMILVNHYKFPPMVSLVFILGSLAIGVLASMLAKTKGGEELHSPVHETEEKKNK